MKGKTYEFYDIFKKSCSYEDGQGDCTKSRESKKCVDGVCEEVKIPNVKKIDILKEHSQSGGGGAVTLDVNSFDKIVLQSKIPVFVDFYATWCGHCQHLAPIWEELANNISSLKSEVLIAKYEASEILPKGITVEGFPTIILFKNGKQIPYEGNREINDFKDFLTQNLEQVGGDRTGRRYWIKNGEKTFENPNGYQNSPLSSDDSDSNSDSDSIDTLNDPNAKLVLRSNISPKKQELNRQILDNYKELHRCNDRNCQMYGNVIKNETIDEHNQKHFEREKRHKMEDFSPISLSSLNKYGGADPKLLNTLLKKSAKKYNVGLFKRKSPNRSVRRLVKSYKKSPLRNVTTIKKRFISEIQQGGCPLCLAAVMLGGGAKCNEHKSKNKRSPMFIKRKSLILNKENTKTTHTCEHCDYTTNKKFNLNRHQLAKHNMQSGGGKKTSAKKPKSKSRPKSRPKSKSKSKSKKNKKGLRLIKIVKSTKHDKKLMAVFEQNGREKTVHFGSAGMSDFTRHRDPARKQRYLDRHRKNENWNNPASAGSLSRYILWGKTSLRASIADYKRKFHFN